MAQTNDVNTNNIAVKQLPNDVFFEVVFQMLREHGEVKIPVKGNSMRPWLHTGDNVLLRSVHFLDEELKVGDIVLANSEIGVVLHRIVAISAEGITLMGDGNALQVEQVAPSDVSAVAVVRYKNGKSVSLRSSKMLFGFRIWHFLRPLRRYLLYILRLMNV